MQEKDIKEIKNKLIDYYGTAMMNGFPMAGIELSEIENLLDNEIMALAEELGL